MAALPDAPISLARVDSVPLRGLPLADLEAWSAKAASPKAFTMPGFVPQREVTLLSAPGGFNKSTFGHQFSLCVAAGLPMLGVNVTRGRALYITCEDDDDEVHWRTERMCRALGVDMETLAGRLHISSLRGRPGNELATFDADGRIRPTATFYQLKATLEETRSLVAVLDNTAHFFIGNENDRAQVTASVNLLYSLCVDLGVTIVLVGHTNKAGDSYSGSTAWLNAVRSQIVISKPEDSSDSNERLLTIGKANYAKQGEELKFRWHDFALVRDEDLPSSWHEEATQVAAVAGDNGLFLACLDARAKDGLIASPNISPNYAPTQFEAMPAAKNIGKARLRKAMERLLQNGEIEVFDYENKGKGRTVKALRRSSRSFPNGLPDASRTVPGRFPEPSPDAARTTPHTAPYTTYREGAAPKASAPPTETSTSLSSTEAGISLAERKHHE